MFMYKLTQVIHYGGIAFHITACVCIWAGDKELIGADKTCSRFYFINSF